MRRCARPDGPLGPDVYSRIRHRLLQRDFVFFLSFGRTLWTLFGLRVVVD